MVEPALSPEAPAKATANSRQPKRRWPWLLAAVVVLLAALIAWFGPTAMGYARTGSAYGARIACSCRYVAGRPLADCRKDFEKGMGLVTLSEDAPSKTVTARFPLLASARAQYQPAWGCRLEPWTE